MLPVTKMQQFCTKDGPGIRTTVFLKGCPLRCVWCHNPEALSGARPFFYNERLCIHCGGCATGCPSGALEPSVTWLSAEEICQRVLRDAPFYGTTGGVTFSGGEPTVHAEKLIPLMERLKKEGIHTALETCGYFDPALLPRLTEVTDLFLWDIKDTDDRRHQANTGVSLAPIHQNLRAADALGAETVLRCILLRSVNLNEDHLRAVAEIYSGLKHCRGIELIPYHAYGAAKYTQLGLAAESHPEWIPSAEELRRAEEFLKRSAPVIRN